ncbi:MAG: helix-turn-helix domain-containing protein [Betaproteobacteria bacterium]|nr:helix-turn-helix domain-containing protein [Betaproteobacteria bacterium]
MPVVKNPTQLGAMLRATRTALNLPAADLAAMAGTSAVLLRRLEQGNATTALEKLFKLLDELGIEVQLNAPPQAGHIRLPAENEKPKRTRVRT